MHRTEPSRLQSLSLQLSDKLAQLVENNERLLELRPGGNFFLLKKIVKIEEELSRQNYLSRKKCQHSLKLLCEFS